MGAVEYSLHTLFQVTGRTERLTVVQRRRTALGKGTYVVSVKSAAKSTSAALT
jgi:hypothetical protein